MRTKVVGCRRPCRRESPRRLTAPCRRRRSDDRRAAAAEHLRARAVLHDSLRLLRLQHLHGDRARHRAGSEPGRLHRHRAARARARRRGAGPGAGPVSTIFVGGGTPTLLPPDDLGRMVAAIDDHFGLTADAEITTESNPESIDAAGLDRLRALGFTRISFGMQSAMPHVLSVLDRVHSPGRPQQAVAEAKAAGFAHTSLDLIYGTPGESIADWQASLDAAIAAEPDHLSAYALIVEEGTRLAVPDPPRRAADDRRRRPGRQVPDRRGAADRRRLRGVRGEQLGPRRRIGVPAQPGLLAQRQLVGDRSGRPQPRRRGALVERQASAGVRHAARGRSVAGARPGGPRRRPTSGSSG